MTKSLLYAAILLAMSFTVPWFFAGEPESPVTATVAEAARSNSFPGWVLYVIGASVLYAILIATLLHFFWDTSADDGEPQADGRADR